MAILVAAGWVRVLIEGMPVRRRRNRARRQTKNPPRIAPGGPSSSAPNPLPVHPWQSNSVAIDGEFIDLDCVASKTVSPGFRLCVWPAALRHSQSICRPARAPQDHRTDARSRLSTTMGRHSRRRASTHRRPAGGREIGSEHFPYGCTLSSGRQVAVCVNSSNLPLLRFC